MIHSTSPPDDVDVPAARREGLGRAHWLVTSNALDAGGRSAESVALDVLAVLALGVGAAEMGVLMTLSGLGFLVLGVPIGILVDRHLSPRLLAATGIGTAAVLGTLVAAWALDALTFTHLAVAMTLTGVLTVLAETTQAALVPRVVPEGSVPRLAARLESADAALGLIVPAAAGIAVGALGSGPVLGLAAAFVLAAGLVALKVRMGPTTTGVAPRDGATAPSESAGQSAGERVGEASADEKPAAAVVLTRWSRFWGEAGEGWHVLRRTPVLWLLTLGSMAGNIGMSLFAPVEAVWILTELRLGPEFLGFQLTAGAAGALAASAVAGRAITRLGERGCIVVGTVGSAVAVALHVAAFVVPAHAPVLLLMGAALWGLMVILGNITQAALFARACPPGALGRVTAMRRTLTRGTVPLSTLAGGALGAAFGVGWVLVGWQVCAVVAVGAVLLAVRRREAAGKAGRQGRGAR